MAAAVGGPGWQEHSLGTTASLSLAQGMACLSGHTRLDG